MELHKKSRNELKRLRICDCAKSATDDTIREKSHIECGVILALRIKVRSLSEGVVKRFRKISDGPVM